MMITTKNNTMRKSELRTLLEWFYDDKYRDLRGETWLRSGGWRPDEDISQLELLKNKFLKDANITRIEYDKLNSGWWGASYYVGVSNAIMMEEGKEIKDTDLKIILNYVKSLKLK